MTAPQLSAGSLGSFEATCSSSDIGISECDGMYTNGPGISFNFGGPFPGSPGFSEQFPYTGFIDFSIGTNGGAFSFGGQTCDYDAVLGGSQCDGEIMMGADLGQPDDTGLPLGDVVTVTGPGVAKGYFCSVCHATTPLFDLNVTATYQFTLTDPGTTMPFSWTGAQYSFVGAAVPEPGPLVSVTLGLAGVAAGVRLRRRNRPAGI